MRDERFGWCEEPELRRRGPTCKLHHPVHVCDCGICNLAIKQRIALSEMKTYRCHKIVQACKIKSVKLWSDNDSIAITLDDDAKTTKVFERSHQMARAVAGDYYAIYDDGYTSRSPAKTFEAGYTEVMPTGSMYIGDSHAPSERSLQLAAQAWCGPDTSHIEMDSRLAYEFAKILDRVQKTS